MTELFFNANMFRWIGGNITVAEINRVNYKLRLVGLDRERKLLYNNIDFLLQGGEALNVLLWGEKGAGKSSLIKELCMEYAPRNLKVVEFCDIDYSSIYSLYSTIRRNSSLYFIIYFDDISFNNSDGRYRNFKSILDGGLEDKPINSIFIATSNRRHLIVEKAFDTNDMYNRDNINEESSLFARFGISIGFYPISQETYLDIVQYYMERYSISIEDWQKKSINYALDRGSRSGRVAKQFVLYEMISAL